MVDARPLDALSVPLEFLSFLVCHIIFDGFTQQEIVIYYETGGRLAAGPGNDELTEMESGFLCILYFSVDHSDM